MGAAVSSVLINRSSELAALRSAYERARSGEPVTVLVSGEAGIGKSRLVAAAIADIGAEPMVLTGNALELGADGTPWVPFLAILRNLLREWGPDRLAAELPATGTALAGWLPELSLPQVGSGQVRLFGEILGLLANAAATRPLVVVLEDLHWADASSRELFAYLIRNLGTSPVLVIATVRTGELPAGHPTRQLLSEIGRRAEVVRLELSPLGPRDVSDLLTALDGRAPHAVASSEIHRRSGGNPLFVEALYANGTASSGGLAGLLLDRVAHLSPAAHKVLATIAVAGGTVADQLLSEVSGEPIDDAVRELIERDQIRVVDSAYVIRHDLIREAVYGALLPGERRRLHHSFAEAIESGPASAALAEHWTVAGHPDKALAAAWQAVATAEKQYAYDEQLNLLERVLALWPGVAAPADLIGVDRATVLERAVAASYTTGRSQAGVEHATAALSDVTAEPSRTAALLRLRGLLRCRIDGSGSDDLVRAEQLVPEGSDDVLRSRVLSALAFTQLVGAPAPDMDTHARQALDLAERTGDQQALAEALLVTGGIELHTDGSPEAVVELMQQARRAAEACGDHHTYLTALQWQGRALAEAGHPQEAVDLLAGAEQQAQRWGRMRARGTMLAQNRAEALTMLGRWDEVLDLVTGALADGPPPWYDATLHLRVAEIAVRRGEYDVAADQLAQMTMPALGAASELALQRRPVDIALAIGRGDVLEADRLLAETLDTMAGRRIAELTITARLYVEALYVEHAKGPARSGQLRSALPASDSWPIVTATLRTGDAFGAGTLAAWDAAAEAWRSVHEVHELARTLIRGAEVAVRTNNKGGARRRLEEARELATQLGAVPLLAEIDDLGRRAGLADVLPRRKAPAFGLTERELVVLRILARGSSNAEIARELFVSPNTVATHVARVLRKLSVSSRTEAAALAHRAGLLDEQQIRPNSAVDRGSDGVAVVREAPADAIVDAVHPARWSGG